MNFLGALDRGDGVNESDFILAVLQHIGTLNLERDIVPWKKVWIFTPLKRRTF